MFTDKQMNVLIESFELKMNLPESDYGTGSSDNSQLSANSWVSRGRQSALPRPRSEHLELDTGSSSYLDYVPVVSRGAREEARREFQLNGCDSPYWPDDDTWRGPGELSGLGPAAQYLRQKSWPEPEASPAHRLPRPRPRSLYEPPCGLDFDTSTPVYEELPPPPFNVDVYPSEVYTEQLTPEQTRVLNSLPDAVLYPLLRKLRADRRNRAPPECRFCKSNGERMSYYRSHSLKDGAGRVSCPVLRAFKCRRCGASGDAAHTIKYCPLSTSEERVQSVGMMRSVRMASGRRRYSLAPSVTDVQDYMLFGEPSPSALDDNRVLNYELDPMWAAVERKLLL